MTATCSLDSIDHSRPGPLSRLLAALSAFRLLVTLIVCTLIAGWGVLVYDHHCDRDRETLSALSAAQYRVRQQEAQLQLLTANGDQGVLLANIETRDMGRAQIRIVPRVGQ